MTPELALKLGKAIALHFEHKGIAPKVVIGKDTRISGYMLETALTSGLVSMGATVLLVGPLPTPAISFLTRAFEANAGIVISASHNPAMDNGIKIFDSLGIKLSDDDEGNIESIFFSDELASGGHDGRPIGKAFRVEDSQQRYREFAKSSIADVSLKGLKVVADCANGAGYRVFPQILSELGAVVSAINDKPDGFNINLNSGATSIAGLALQVVAQKADVGLALDGDADRLIIVDALGNEINGDKIMALLALHLKEKGLLAKDTVVATVMSNAGFEDYMARNGITVVRSRVGDRYIIEEMRRNSYNFGGEQSGHIIFGAYSTTGDGIIAALQFLAIMLEKGKGASELANTFELYPQVLLNVNVKEKRPLGELKALSSEIREAQKLLGNRGRVLVRYSGTENVLRIMVEGENESDINGVAQRIAQAAKEENG